MTANEETMRGVDPKRFENEARAEKRSAQRRVTIRSWTSGTVALAAFLAGWWTLWKTQAVNPLFISNPIAVTHSLRTLLGESSTWANIWATFAAAILALIVGAAFGILTGIAFAASPAIRRGLNPYLAIINGIPRPALAPIFILWFGLGPVPKVIVGASLVYFVLLLNTLAGMTGIDHDIVLLARSLGMGRRRFFATIQFPGALPSIVAGLRLGAVYSVLGVVVSEIVASYSGLGQMLVQSTNQLDISASLAIVVLMSAMAVLLDTAVRVVQARVNRGAGQ